MHTTYIIFVSGLAHRNLQVFSRVTTRPAGRIRRLSKPRGSSQAGSGGVWKSRGLDRIGPGGDEASLTARVGSGRVTLGLSDLREVI